MMKLNVFIYPAICLCFGMLASCEQVVNIPLPEHEPRLVINAGLEGFQAMDVYLSRSYGTLSDINFDDPEALLVPDAQVEIHSQGQIFPLAYRDTMIETWIGDSTKLGKYTSETFSYAYGQAIEIRATHPDYPDVRTQITVPYPAHILGVELEQNVIRVIDPEYEEARYQSLLHLDIMDHAGIGEAYAIIGAG